jgi:hypothetical protein
MAPHVGPLKHTDPRCTEEGASLVRSAHDMILLNASTDPTSPERRDGMDLMELMEVSSSTPFVWVKTLI